MSQTMNEDLNVIANSNLEITYLDGDLAIIQQLDDEPNDVGGLTSAQLKAKFDQAGLAIQSYLNNTLIPELLAADATEAAREAAEAAREAAESARVTAEAARAAAESAREDATSGIVAQAAQKASEAAASAVRAEQVALGNIPDGSLAKAKLVPEVQSALDRAASGGEIDITLANNDPRNWGLGSDAGNMPNASLNDCKANGWYINQGNDAVNCPTINGTAYSYGVVVVITKSLSHIVQVYYPSVSGTAMSFVRSFVDGAWAPWDTNNPPMLLGVEYRTTERYNGKPVYTMAVDFGALPVDTYKIVAHNIANVDCMLPVYGVIPELGMQIPGKSIANGFWNNDIDVFADRANIQVITRNCNDLLKNDGWTAQITLRYTKTTD